MSHKERYIVTLDARGRLVLPAALRERLGLREGDRLVLDLQENGDVRLVSTRTVARRLHGYFADRWPGRDLAAELIEERRAEAAREDEESEAHLGRAPPSSEA